MACPRSAHDAFLLAMVMIASSLCSAQHAVVQDGRETIRLGNDRSGVVWAVQLSDLHFSSYRTERATSFETLMGPLLRLVSPSLVLITGDLTDAKSKDLMSRRQDRAEWVRYRQAISKVIEDSGLPEYSFYDLRGNHDKFGVPEVDGTLDYFSKYSISSLRNRKNTVQSVTLLNSGWKHLFVGVDTSMEPGLRGPCNLFGHPTDQQLANLGLELSQWDTCAPQNITKVVFGHFPISFTASTEKGDRLEDVLADHSIAAYLCGHLHKSFGANLIKHHVRPRRRAARTMMSGCKAEAQDGNREFWEWEMGDWRKRRTMRIIAIDRGHTSYVDFDFLGLNASDIIRKKWLPTLVVPTYPLDSQRMGGFAQLPSWENSVRALIFSPQPIVSVVVQFFDTRLGKLVLLEELEMHSIDQAGDMGYVYESHWDSTKYTDMSATRYALKVSVVDLEGTASASSLRTFSVQRKVNELKKTWREFLVMGFVWEEAFTALIWLAFSVLFIFFILPKMVVHFLMGNGGYLRWSNQLFRKGNQRLTVRRAAELCAWFFLQGTTRNLIWWEQLMIWVWLIFLPWYWGEGLAENLALGSMTLGGWRLPIEGVSEARSGLGWPDLMAVVLPYLYFVIIPLYTLICALSAEAFLHEVYQVDILSSSKKKDRASHTHSEMQSLSKPHGPALFDDINQINGADSPLGGTGLSKSRSSSCRPSRVALLGGCVLISVVYFGQVSALVGAYGVMALVASPGFAWPAPLLIITTVLQSSSCKKRE